MTSKEKQIFRLISNRIKELDATAVVVLYGSHARGQALQDSDWDILVLLDKNNVTLSIEQEFRHHMLDIELEIGEPISVIVRSKMIWESKYRITPLYKSIKTEGVQL